MRGKLVLTLGVAASIALGASVGTFALFSDQTASQNNQIMAGTLSLNSWRDQGDTVPGPMFYTTPAEGNTGTQDGLLPTGYWAPGDTHHRVLLVRNTGSLGAWILSLGADMHPGTSQHLADKLEYRVTADSAGTVVLASGILGDLIDTDYTFAPKIDLPSSALPVHLRPPKAFHFWVTLPLDADNSYQGETLKVDFHLNAEQKKNNP